MAVGSGIDVVSSNDFRNEDERVGTVGASPCPPLWSCVTNLDSGDCELPVAPADVLSDGFEGEVIVFTGDDGSVDKDPT